MNRILILVNITDLVIGISYGLHASIKPASEWRTKRIPPIANLPLTAAYAMGSPDF